VIKNGIDDLPFKAFLVLNEVNISSTTSNTKPCYRNIASDASEIDSLHRFTFFSSRYLKKAIVPTFALVLN
jgi:hypothetical protein